MCFPCQENISGQRPVHKPRAGCWLSSTVRLQSQKILPEPDHKTQTYLAGRGKGAEIASTAVLVCSDVLTFPTGTHIPPRRDDIAIRVAARRRTGSAPSTPPPPSPPTRALIWSKFSTPRSCQIDSDEFLFLKDP